MSVAANPAQPEVKPEAKPDNEWTILVFFAGEENISPAMISQLKAIKDAGFEERTSVLIHYDPNKRGVGTVTFDINRLRKAEKGTSIGDGKDPFVRNLIEDRIDGGAPKNATAEEALKSFLMLGVQKYRARHYAVVLVGHGMIVGNDAFLPDAHPDTAITLQQLGEIMNRFNTSVEWNGGVVELIGLHSCSMSAVELVYELKGAARYLIATEGVSFVGSWPYRQLMKKILLTIDKTKDAQTPVNIGELIMSVQRLALHNSTDFMFSGISADLCLCSLDPKKVETLKEPLRNLSKALKEGLNSKRGLELITLAHLKAQSYWQETYTDIFDFCLCLERECDRSDAAQKEMAVACGKVKEALKETNDPGGLIVRSDYFGPLYQYSHGLSVYFPWAAPVLDDPPLPGDDILKRYAEYKFTKELTTPDDQSWLSFLNEYFEKTKRTCRQREDDPSVSEDDIQVLPKYVKDLMSRANIGGIEALEGQKTSGQLQKTSGQLFASGCSCSVKNYPMRFMRSERANEDPNVAEEDSSHY